VRIPLTRRVSQAFHSGGEVLADGRLAIPIDEPLATGLCWPSWACGVEHSVGHFVSTHRVAIGITIGALALVTGVGALVARASVAGIALGLGAGILNAASSELDEGPCIDGHNRAACGGLIFGLVGGLGRMGSTSDRASVRWRVLGAGRRAGSHSHSHRRYGGDPLDSLTWAGR
jgi:hypothetical protein